MDNQLAKHCIDCRVIIELTFPVGESVPAANDWFPLDGVLECNSYLKVPSQLVRLGKGSLATCAGTQWS
jgi:hypothetical protein